LISALKEGGDILHQQVPPEYLPYIVSIIAFSFENNMEKVNEFLNFLKQAFRTEVYEASLTSNLRAVLSEIIGRTQAGDTLFFGSLTHSIQVVRRAVDLIKEK
jgi:hypothetical protein